jgi:hypothetical protein
VRAGVHDALVMAGIWSDDHGLLWVPSQRRDI